MFKIYKGHELSEDDIFTLTMLGIDTFQWIVTNVRIEKEKGCHRIKLKSDVSQTSHRSKNKRKKTP